MGVESVVRAMEGSPKGSNRSVTRTLRLEPALDAFLAQSAERAGVSPSSLVNQALRKFVEWDSYAEKYGVVSIPQSLVARLMHMLPEAKVREIGRWVGTTLVREFLTFWF